MLEAKGQQQITKDLSIRAALLIQCWFRRFKARLEMRRRVAWAVYQSMEYSSEASQLKLHMFFKNLLALNARVSPGARALKVDDGNVNFISRLERFGDIEDLEILMDAEFEDIKIHRNYTGPHLTFPLSAAHIQVMIDSFRKGELLHAKYLLQLLHESRLLLKTKPNIYLASTSISKQITVVGDLHGQLDDLLVILYKNGLPEVMNPYVFNGDFVDRGPHSVEVAALLFACQLVWPTAVFINRGNHEDMLICSKYGFTKELVRKYPKHSNRLAILFFDVFTWLPLCTVIDSRILVTHGGVSETLDLNTVLKLERRLLLSPAKLKVKPQMSETAVSLKELDHVLQLLWNDPMTPEMGTQSNTARGVGLQFGSGSTSTFLRRHGLTMLVRSHECKMDGFEYTHQGQVLTIFSASNYYGSDEQMNMNMGAYVKFDESLKPRIYQFSAAKVSAKSIGQRVSNIEERALQALRSKIASCRSELLDSFRLLDNRNTGHVTVEQWATVMKTVTKLVLPWRILRHHLVEGAGAKKVVYMSTFKHLTIQNRMSVTSSTALSSFTEVMYKNREDLETIFRVMDRDNSGTISRDEFKEACQILSCFTGQPMSESEVMELADMIDLNKDGCIDFNEFLEAFRIVDFQAEKGK